MKLCLLSVSSLTLTLGMLLPAVPAFAGAEYYAGWTVGNARDGYGTILRSTDSGRSWFRQGAGQIAGVDLSGVVAVDPDTAWVVGYTDGYGTIYHTDDGGRTWQRKGTPAEIPDLDLKKVSSPDGETVWAVGGDTTASTILHTSDGGLTWSDRIPPGYDESQLQGVSAPDPETVWVTGGCVEGYPVILKSADAGSTWTRQSGGDVARTGNNHILGISALDRDTAWAIGGQSVSQGWFVLKTTDGGETWLIQTEGAHDGNEIHAVDPETVWAVSDSVISWTFDGGGTWGGHNSYEYTMGISAVDSRLAWAVTTSWKGSIWRTEDGGENWTVLERLGGEDLPGLWTVSFSSQTVPPPFRPVVDGKDYNGDGRDDIAVWRGADGRWLIDCGLSGRPQSFYFGAAGDLPASGDYDGDGTTDPAVFRPASGLWAVRGVTRLYFGKSGDIPVPADYRGDGRTDPAIFRETSGLWAVRGVTRAYFGAGSDLPVPVDCRGDGTSGIGIFRPAAGLWAVRGLTRFYFGAAGDYPVPASYSGDGREFAVFRPGAGLWAVRNLTRLYFGTAGDYPQPGGYRGDGTALPAVYRPASGLWAIRGSTRFYWGGGDYLPVCW